MPPPEEEEDAAAAGRRRLDGRAEGRRAPEGRNRPRREAGPRKAQEVEEDEFLAALAARVKEALARLLAMAKAHRDTKGKTGMTLEAQLVGNGDPKKRHFNDFSCEKFLSRNQLISKL